MDRTYMQMHKIRRSTRPAGALLPQSEDVLDTRRIRARLVQVPHRRRGGHADPRRQARRHLHRSLSALLPPRHRAVRPARCQLLYVPQVRRHAARRGHLRRVRVPAEALPGHVSADVLLLPDADEGAGEFPGRCREKNVDRGSWFRTSTASSSLPRRRNSGSRTARGCCSALPSPSFSSSRSL